MHLVRRALLAAVALPGAAGASPSPAIEFTGAIAPPAPRRLSTAEIEALGAPRLVTVTPWTEGPQSFDGAPLARVLEAVGAHGRTLRAVALNDYAVSMPAGEVVAAGAFLATRQGGAALPVRSRGPFWIVFPWSARPELDTALIRQRSIWQVARIEVG
jgi:hypothetical protein